MKELQEHEVPFGYDAAAKFVKDYVLADERKLPSPMSLPLPMQCILSSIMVKMVDHVIARPDKVIRNMLTINYVAFMLGMLWQREPHEIEARLAELTASEK